MPMVNFGEYAPDLPPFGHPGVVRALNTVPRSVGYGPMPALRSVSLGALASRVFGSISGRDKLGQAYNLAGTATKIYYTTTASPVDVTRAAGDYTTVAAGSWEFAQYGQDVFGVNFNDEVQYLNLDTLSAVSPSEDSETDTPFSGSAGQIPQAKHIGVVRDFVAVGNVNDSVNTSDGQVPERVHWGPIANPAQQWPTAGTSAAKAVQSDYQDIRGGAGAVQRIIGAHEIGLIFCEKQLWRMDYTGGVDFFSFFPVEEQRGALVPGSIAATGRWTIFLTEDGFHKTDGTQSVPIGKERIDRTFFADLDRENAHRVTAAIDPRLPLYVCAYPGSGNSSGNPNKILIYDYELDKWSHGAIELEVLIQTLPAGVDADMQLTATAGWLGGTEGVTTTNSISSDVSGNIITNLDAAEFLGSDWQLGAYDTDHQQARFDASPAAAIIETGDLEITPGRHSHVSGVRPVGTSNGHLITIGSRDTAFEDVTYSGAQPVNADTGVADQRVEGRYHRVLQTVLAPTSDAQFQGFDIEAVPTGVR